MRHRVIRILPAPPVPGSAGAEPCLSGPTEPITRLLAGLDQLACRTFGRPLPRSAWLRALDLDDGQAVLTLAPALRCPAFAHGAFELLKRELVDTDIYVTS